MIRPDRPLLLRPHHGLCLRHFIGRGYSDGFTARMAGLCSWLREYPQQPVRLKEGADFLCAICPNRRGNGCVSGQKAAAYDAAVRELCSLSDEQVLLWETFSTLVETKIIQAGRFEAVCHGCQWFGLCAPLAQGSSARDKTQIPCGHP